MPLSYEAFAPKAGLGQSDFGDESILFFGCHQLLVRLGERKVLDQTGKVFELWRAEKGLQVRRRRLEIVNRGGIGFGQATRQLLDGTLHLLWIGCPSRSRFAVRSFRCGLQSEDEGSKALLQRYTQGFNLSRRS